MSAKLISLAAVLVVSGVAGCGAEPAPADQSDEQVASSASSARVAPPGGTATEATGTGTFTLVYGTWNSSYSLNVIKNTGSGSITGIGAYCTGGGSITSGLKSTLAPGETMAVYASVSGYSWHCQPVFYGTNASNSPFGPTYF